jgi:hypothetical protein
MVVDTSVETEEKTSRTLVAGDEALVAANSLCLLVLLSLTGNEDGPTD